MRNKKQILAFIMALVFFITQFNPVWPFATSVEAAPLDRIDFATGTTGTWINKDGSSVTGLSIVPDAGTENGEALKIANVSQGMTPVCKDFGKIQNGTYETRMKVKPVSAGSNVTLGVSFRVPGADGKFNGINFMGQQGGTKNGLLAESSVTYKDPISATALQEIKADTWYTIRTIFNDKKVSVYVDNICIVKDFDWPGWMADEGYVGIYGWASNMDYFVDYIKTSTETTTTDAPTITTQPTDATAMAGTSAAFSILASGTGVVSYKWQQSTDGTSWIDADGTNNNSTYTISSAKLLDNGKKFRCVVTNTKNSVGTAIISDIVTLTVNPAGELPTITQNPVAVFAEQGESAQFSIKAEISSGELTYQWQRSTAANGAFTNVAGATSDTYSFTPTTADNGYFYRCIVSFNGQEINSTAAKLTVIAAWPSTVEPVYTTFGEGELQLLNWKNIESGANYIPKPSVVYDPSAMNEKALKIDFKGIPNRVYSTDLPQNIIDGEYAMRVKAVKSGSGVDPTQEIRFGLLTRVQGASYNEFTRSGSAWFGEKPGSYTQLTSEGIFTPGQWHTIRLLHFGKNVTVYFDGVKIADNITWDQYNTNAGGFGLRSFFAEQSIYIDNLYVGPIREESELPKEFAVDKPDSDAFDYIKDYADEITGNWINANTYAAHPSAVVNDEAATDGKALKLDIPAGNIMLADSTSSVTKNAVYELRMKSVPETSIKTEYDPINFPGEMKDTAGNIAILTRYSSATTYAVLYYDAKTSEWSVRDANNIGSIRGIVGKGPVLEPNKYFDVKVRYEDRLIKLWINNGTEEVLVGSYIANHASYPMTRGKIGVGSINDKKALYIDSIKYKEYLGITVPDDLPAYSGIKIASDKMNVTMDNRYPIPVQYELGGKTVKAQEELLHTLEINGEEWLAVVQSTSNTADSVTYNVRTFEDPDDESTYIDLKFNYKVVGTTLACDIEVIGEIKTKLYTFEMPKAVLAKFTGVLGTNAANQNILCDGFINPGTWNNTADLMFNINDRSPGVVPYSIAFLTNKNENIAVGLINDSTDTPTRNMVTLVGDNDSDPSNKIPKKIWINNGSWTYRGITESVAAQFPQAANAFEPEKISFRVLLTEDNNGSGSADWQDAANLYREYAPVPNGGNDIRNFFSYVSFNFNSLAQNYFLRGLDDGKKLYNFTDGFGQMILEKGYAAEGHDDSHPDVGDHIGIRQGGLKDFNTLINEGLKYNMKIGVHVNVGEYILDSFYGPPKDFYYTDANGYPNSGGWGWVDQAFYFDQTKDLASGELAKRFGRLKETVPNLAWIYVDIYSGADWRAKKVSEVLTKMYGWMNATEFSGPMEQDVIWTHWGTDLYYPTSGNGSKIFRFIYNNTKDVFPATSPYVSDMLRGSVQPGIGTWQNRTSIKEGVEVFYNQNLPSKYMQYFPVSRWENNQITFGAPTAVSGTGTVSGKAGAKVVKNANNTEIYAPDGTKVAVMDYIDSDGKVEIKGSKTQLFIPWNPITEEKIYYWNSKGDITTWKLPNSWSSETSVQVYKLTDNGKELVNSALAVSGGSLDLSSLSLSTPYIIYKSSGKLTEDAHDFGSVEAGGGYLADPGFDTHKFGKWTTDNETNFTMKNDKRWNGILEANSAAGKISNQITGLTAGKTYTASVWLQIGANPTTSAPRNVTLRVTDGGGTDVSRTAVNTKLVNGDEPGKWKYNGGTEYPNMTRIEVRFTATSDTAVFNIELDAGAEKVVFDDARVWENPTKTTVPEGYAYFEDFENVSEGLGAFVYIGNTGNHSHLAEKAPDGVTTQIENYVIGGHFSLKTYEEDARPILRTTPNTVKFEPNTKYTVTLDYTSLPNNAYYVKAQAGDDSVLAEQSLATATDKANPGKVELTFTTKAGDNNTCILVGTSAAPGSLHKNCLIIDNFAVQMSPNAAQVPVLTGPESMEVNLNDDAALTVTASVTDGGTLSYQWYTTEADTATGGTAIPGATAAIYNAPTTSAGATNYYVVVTNTNNNALNEKTATATSELVTVTVSDTAPVTAATPEITKQPTDVSANVNDTATLSVEATVSDGGTLSYQWYETDESAGLPIDGETSATFNPPTDTEGTKKYYVVVTNTKDGKTASVTSAVATVTISEELPVTPVITKQPESVAVNLGEPATLEVEASITDDGEVSYQWYKTATDETAGTPIDGETSETFNPPTDVEGTNKYYVVVTNKKGDNTTSVTSDIVTVGVSQEATDEAAVPVISKQPENKTVNTNGTAVLSVEAIVNDGGNLSYQWYKTDSGNVEHGVAITGATSSTFNPPTNTAGTNNYYCVVTNEKDGNTASTTSNVVKVTVNPLTPPTSFTIRYDANYGSGTMNSVNVANGANYTLLSNSFSRGNYNFIGWSISRSGGAILQPGDTIFNVKSNMVFYAQWEYIGSRDKDNNSNNSGSNSNGSNSSGTSSSTTPATTSDSGTKNIGKPVDNGTTTVNPDKTPSGNPNTEKDYPKLTNEKDKGYISGYEDKTFKPNKGVTRYEVSSIIFRLLENPNAYDAKQATVYNDVEYSQWYGKAVTTLSALGILHGYEDGTFRGEKTITRAEFITVLSLIHPLKEGGKTNFGDVPEDAWYYKYLQSAISYGWVSGYQDRTFRPNQPITRAEAVVILNRILEIEADDKTATNEFSDVPETFWAHKDIMLAAGFFK